MRPFTLFGERSSDLMKKWEADAKVKIQEEIKRQIPALKVKLQSDGFSDHEIKEIIQKASEEQCKLSMTEFHRLFLIEKQKIFLSKKK